jgi:hypothetical protein
MKPTLEEYAARVKALKYSDIKRIMETPEDLFHYMVTSANKANQGEVKYNVWRDRFGKWWCSCNDFLYRNKEDNELYQCKHIKRVLAMIEESAKRQFKQASKEVPK